MIPFNKPTITGDEIGYIESVIKKNKCSGDGDYTRLCHKWFADNIHCENTLLTTSCTHALEMSAILLNIQKDDEVIMPSFTFTSTANAFAIRGAKIVFVDIRPDTMNIDETKIESAITKKTKAIVPVHYAGVPCEMDTIMALAKKHHLFVIEDAAQAILSTYRGTLAGTIGDLGSFSFHDTKNIQCGEGGVLLINDPSYKEAAEILREKGTNRSRFFRGEIDKYGWVDIGSSYLPSELNAAFLYAQLQKAKPLIAERLKIWEQYHFNLKELEDSGKISLPTIPENCTHNGHMFYIKAEDLEERTGLIDHMKADGIHPVFHYIPLHSSIAGKKFGMLHGADQWTTKESERILRLPIWNGMDAGLIKTVSDSVYAFYRHPVK
jgi:dTDP-4-amino-4,6-dideoxygalactose transaminase